MVKALHRWWAQTKTLLHGRNVKNKIQQSKLRIHREALVIKHLSQKTFGNDREVIALKFFISYQKLSNFRIFLIQYSELRYETGFEEWSLLLYISVLWLSQESFIKGDLQSSTK